MITSYGITYDQLLPCPREQAAVLVYWQPTEAEKQDLQREFDIEALDIESIYDPDEVPRIELDPSRTLLIWKRPNNASSDGHMTRFEVSSIGILFRGGKVGLVVPRGEPPVSGREFKAVASAEDFALRVLLNCIHHYLGHLKAIKLMSAELQSKIVTSMENKYLLQMFTLSESLIYYYNALEANGTVLGKLRGIWEKNSTLRNRQDLLEMLDDVIIENQQASKQAGIYSTVLSGLMDARGSIVNNNVNSLLKNLTMINVVFLPLNLIASMGGMSEYSSIMHGVDWRISYGALVVGMMALGWAIWRGLSRLIDHTQHNGKRP